MDADDFSKKNRFKIQVEFLKRNKEIDLVGSMAKTFEGKILKVPKDDNLIKKTIIKKILLYIQALWLEEIFLSRIGITPTILNVRIMNYG